MVSKRIFLSLIVVIAGIAVASFLARDLLLSATKTKAAGTTNSCTCDDPNKCYPDGCTRDPVRAPDVCAELPSVYDAAELTGQDGLFCTVGPPCCDAMVARRDTRACCWPERAACTPQQCAAAGGDQRNCGWWWKYHDGYTNGATGYGCMIGDSPETMRPINGGQAPQPTTPPQPTSAPQPTNPPQQPTSIPTTRPQVTTFLPPVIQTLIPQQPTSTPKPNTAYTPNTYTSPYFPNGTDNTGSQGQTQPSGSNTGDPQTNPDNTQVDSSGTGFQAPSMNLPDVKTVARNVVNVDKIEQTTDKPLAAVKTTALAVKSLDQQLEMTVEGWIQRFRQGIGI
ncbi:MAG: hypothetical protein ACEQSA_00620 [Weeksellaceae bacterium]